MHGRGRHQRRPTLKAARVGIGSDIALVGDNIRALPHLLGLAKKPMRAIALNLTASWS